MKYVEDYQSGLSLQYPENVMRIYVEVWHYLLHLYIEHVVQVPVWDSSNHEASLNEFKSLFPSLSLLGDEKNVLPEKYCVDDPGVQLVCKYLHQYKKGTLDNHVYNG